MGNAFTWEQDDDIWNHFYACACSKHMWESNEMTIRIIRFLDDMGSIMSWSPTIVTCSCYNNDFYMHYPIMWKHCGSYDGFRRTFYRSWYMLYGSKSSFLYHFHYAENNLASNRGLIPSRELSSITKRLSRAIQPNPASGTSRSEIVPATAVGTTAKQPCTSSCSKGWTLSWTPRLSRSSYWSLR